jgi:hypothetical protein
MVQTEKTTGMKDKDFNLVSMLYHALEGAWTYATYLEDAQNASDHELAKLFTEALEQHEKLAEGAKELLAQRIG